MNVTQWRMAKKHGYRRDFLIELLKAPWERFWACRVRRQHRVKMDSHGACHRCGKRLT